jgi:hypothetical protein
LIEIALTDPDTRVATVAGNSVLDRAFGKPRDFDPKEERQPTVLDTSGLTNAERVLLLALLRRVQLQQADPRPAEIDDTAER